MQKHHIHFLPPLGAELVTMARRVAAVWVLCAVLCGTAFADSQRSNVVIQADQLQSVPASVENVPGSYFKRTEQVRALKSAISARNDLMLRNSLVQRVQANQQKSRRQVIDEVERSYNAKVLKVSLDQGAGEYVVRILQSDGRVRTIRVSAYR